MELAGGRCGQVTAEELGNGKGEGDECNYQGVIAVEGMGSGWRLV
jgi:hypothetical protein